MIKSIFRKWKHNKLNITFLFLGLFCSMIILSYGANYIHSARLTVYYTTQGDADKQGTITIANNKDNPLKYDDLIKILEKYASRGDISVIMPFNELGISSEVGYCLDCIISGDSYQYTPPIQKGRFLTVEEGKSENLIAVYGDADEFHTHKRPWIKGDSIQLGNSEFKTVGVVGIRGEGWWLTRNVYIPYKTMPKEFKELPINFTINLLANGKYKVNNILAEIKNDLSIINTTIGVNYQKSQDPETLKFINDGLYQSIKQVTAVSSIVIIVVIINIINFSIFIVIKRKKEIAISKALGLPDWYLLLSNFIEMLILCFLSSLIALVFHYLMNNISVNYIAQLKELDFFDISYLNFALAFLVSLGISVFATIIPMKVLIRIQPAAAIKS